MAKEGLPVMHLLHRISLICAAISAFLPLAAAQAQTAATPATPAPTTPAPAAAPATLPAPPLAPSYVLKYKFTPGNIWRYNVSTNMSGSIPGPSGTIAMNTLVNLTLTQSVQSVRATDGAGTVLMKVDPFTISNNGQTMPLPASLVSQYKTGFSVTLAPDGKTIAIDNVPGGTVMTPQSIQQMSQMSYLPDGPVKVGDTWRGNTTINQIGLTIYTKMTLDQVTTQPDGTNIAHISLKYYADTPKAAAGAAAAPNFTISGTGATLFNIDQGRIEHSDGAMVLSMTLPSGSTPTMPTMAYNIKTNMDLIPFPPAPG
jgi:hypothetical protein